MASVAESSHLDPQAGGREREGGRDGKRETETLREIQRDRDRETETDTR